MRLNFALAVLLAAGAGSAFAQDITSEKGKLSYAVGWDIGADIKRRGAEFDVESLIQASASFSLAGRSRIALSRANA